jgi:hypothetical protein
MAGKEAGRFKIFVSCSASDAQVARGVADALNWLLDDVEVFISTDMELGSQWIDGIKEEVEKADLFLLLVTVGSTAHSYSGFELGLFKASMFGSGSGKWALAVYSSNVRPPAILADIQNVRAVPEDLERFLEWLWGIVSDRRSATDRPDASRRIKESSVKISEAFDKVILDQVSSEIAINGYSPDELKISFQLPSSSSEKLPNEALVSSTRMEIFGLQKAAPSGTDWTWETYIAHTKKDPLNLEWPKELENACIDFATGRLSIFRHMYRSTYTGKTYQPIIYRALLAETGGQAGKRYSVTLHMIETSAPEIETSKIDENLIFVIAAFNEESEVIFQGICAAAESHRLVAKRVKDVVGDYRITEQLLNMIRSARLVVCDLSFERPNVYFELGFARGIGKKVITVARKGTILHFDVKDWTCIFYSDSREVERDLRARFEIELRK